MFQDNSKLLKDAIENAAAAMGQGVEGINAATLSMEQISLKDLSPEDQAKQIEAWFKKLANAFSDGVSALDAMKKPGEDSFTALIRLSEALQSVNENTQKFGGTVLALSLASASAASELVDKMGGLDTYLSKTSLIRITFTAPMSRSGSLPRSARSPQEMPSGPSAWSCRIRCKGSRTSSSAWTSRQWRGRTPIPRS